MEEEKYLLKIKSIEDATSIEVSVDSGKELFTLACCLLQLIKETPDLEKAIDFVGTMLETDPEARRIFDNVCINVPDFNTLLKN